MRVAWMAGRSATRASVERSMIESGDGALSRGVATSYRHA
jgi:hypothetical protein